MVKQPFLDKSAALTSPSSSVIAMNLLSTDEILRAGRTSLKPDGQQ